MKRLMKVLIALYYKIKYLKKCRLNAMTNIILRNCAFEGKNAIGDYTYLSHTSLGFASYIGNSSEFSNTTIGKYCSIGSYVRVVSATHPTGMVSSYPAFYSDTYRVSYVRKSKYKEHLTTSNGNECEIGNDVWIGDNVLIKGGVIIGNGAIVAMGSIVTHDVEPYSIVAGVPARIIRKRFDCDVIDQLQSIKWWDKSEEWLKSHVEEFEDAESFVRKHYYSMEEN